jgi:TonB family protein
MSKPLVRVTSQPQDLQFTHFGVLDVGGQNKGTLFTSIGINLLLAFIFIILSAAAVKTSLRNRRLEELTFVATKPPAPLPKPVPKIVPPKPLPKPPVLTPAEPKIVLPKVTPVEAPKPIPVMQPKPLPVITPAPPKMVVAMAAPKPVTVNLGKAVSLPNHDLHPAVVALGQQNNPIAPSNRPATSAVNLGNSGMAGMPPGGGRGPASTAVNLGSGQPGGSLSGGGSHAVVGVKLGGVTGGTPGATGNGLGVRPMQVALGHAPAPPASSSPTLAHPPARTSPQVLYKPRPEYTPAAIQAKVEGMVSVRIRVSAAGSVTVLGVTNGLGYGLDQSAIRAVEGTRFRPAMDANGNPADWEGVVNISFQMAS